MAFIFLMPAQYKSQEKHSPLTIQKKLDLAQQSLYSAHPAQTVAMLKTAEREADHLKYDEGISRIGYMLAIIYVNSSDYINVINLDEKFLKAGLRVSDYNNVSHIHRLKGCAYSELGLLGKAEQEMKRALSYAEKMPLGNKKSYAMGLIYSNKANHLMKGNAAHNEILSQIRKSIKETEKISDSIADQNNRKYSMISYSYIMMAKLFEKRKEDSLAEEYYLKALQIHREKPVPLVEKVVLLSQLGFLYYDRKEYDKAIGFAEAGLATERLASSPQLRQDLLEVLSKSYMEIHQPQKSANYLRRFTALNDSISSINKIAVNAALNKDVSRQEELRLNNLSKQYLIYVLSALVLIIFALSILIHRKKQKKARKVRQLLHQLKMNQKSADHLTLSVSNKKNHPPSESKAALMSNDAEQKLLEKLVVFEESQLYLRKGVSLPYVAAELETNTKYLSYIIKTYRGKDFSDYINGLKISYIVQKLTEDPKYRRYKLNILAEEAGFSSHSKFGTVFKAALGVTPSVFCKMVDDSATKLVNN